MELKYFTELFELILFNLILILTWLGILYKTQYKKLDFFIFIFILNLEIAQK